MAILYAIIFWITLILSPVIFIYGIIKRSWTAMLLCFITILPISFYFLGGESFVFYIGFTPIILLILSAVFLKNSHEKVKNG